MVLFNNAFRFMLLVVITYVNGVVSMDYGTALTNSILYFEAQRSGKLPDNQRVTWRGDSGLEDGADGGVDLVGGYYDSGDNVIFGFPLAFTTTMLGWSVVEFRSQLETKNELENALSAIKWGTDYLIKAHPEPNILYVEVGDGDSDHACWQRPEDMTTPRSVFKIDEQHPGSDLAAESAAALAAASIAFKLTDPSYANELITHAKQLFEFAQNHPGKYQDSVPVAGKYYASSGFEDELLWAAAWLQRATNDVKYLNYLEQAGNTGGVRSVFSWDDKFVGTQVLASKLLFEKKGDANGKWKEYKSNAEGFICSIARKGNSNTKTTPGGLLWFLEWNNLQYVSTAVFIASTYSQYLTDAKTIIQCPNGDLNPSDLKALVRSQVDYILGSNPKNLSYMIGFGSNYVTHAHHRASSIVSIKEDSSPVTCKGGFDEWFNKNAPNPNVLVGGVVGGPDQNDGFFDSRSNFQSSEPATVTPAPLVGVLASLAS